MTFRTSALISAVLAAALLASLPAVAARKPLRLRETCVTRAERAHVLRFRATDGVRLIGVELGAGPHVAILAHQGGTDLCIWVPYARVLAARGYHVLVFDHRGFGSSGQSGRSTRRDRVDYDVLGAIRTMRRRGATTVVLGGGSLGGAAVLAAAARAVPPVSAVMSLSSPTRYEKIDVLAAARRITVPTIFMATEEDQPFPDDARTMYDACPSAEKQLAIFPGVWHGAPMLRDPQARAVADDFVARHSR
jgi:alpha-beta hydrolase superfamily lysophospholipase